jgi:RNase P subunit RPR2
MKETLLNERNQSGKTRHYVFTMHDIPGKGKLQYSKKWKQTIKRLVVAMGCGEETMNGEAQRNSRAVKLLCMVP